MATNNQQTETHNPLPAEAASSITTSTASSQDPLPRYPADFGLPFSTQNAGTTLVRLNFIAPVDYPHVESPANIMVPLHFTSPSVDYLHEPGHPWYDTCRKIEGQLIDVCDSLQIYGMVVYGRVHSSGSSKGPRVLAFMMLPKSIARWKEVEVATKSLLEETFHGDGPPVRFYIENYPAIEF